MQTEGQIASPTRTGREDQLQFLRFWAFFNVFVCHGEQWLFFKYPTSHCSTAAVSFFFMLSGLVTALASFNKDIRLSWREEGKYLWRKVKKIYPLYLFTTLYLFLYTNTESLTALFDVQRFPGQLVRNLLLVQSWSAEGAFSHNGVGWFLSTLTFLSVFSLPVMFLLNKINRRPKGWLLLSGLSVVLMCCFRINYLLLIFPVTWVWGGGKKLCLKTVLFTLLGLCLVIGIYLLTSQWSAPYALGFPYALSRAGSLDLMVRMLLSHFKANLLSFFAFHRYSPVLWRFRLFYLAMLVLCLFKAFLQVRKDGRGLKPGLNAASVWSFLWLFSALGIVLIFNDVSAWTDFHILAPMLWLIPVYLVCREKKLLPALALAGSLALTVFLCFQPSMGAYADPDRFDPPVANESLSTAMSYIAYDPEADDPFENTVRTDLSGERLLMELDAGLGLQYGWFTPDSLGKSRWILTDTLKVALEGYEQVYSTHGAAVYRKTEAPEDP